MSKVSGEENISKTSDEKEYANAAICGKLIKTPKSLPNHNNDTKRGRDNDQSKRRRNNEETQRRKSNAPTERASKT